MAKPPKKRLYEKPPFAKPARDKDIDTLNDAMGTMTVGAIFNNTYLSRSAIRNIQTGKTKKPQHMTMVGIAAARGLRWKLVKG